MKNLVIGIGSIIAWEIGKAMVRAVLAAISVVLFLIWLWRAMTPQRELWR